MRTISRALQIWSAWWRCNYGDWPAPPQTHSLNCDGLALPRVGPTSPALSRRRGADEDGGHAIAVGGAGFPGVVDASHEDHVTGFDAVRAVVEDEVDGSAEHDLEVEGVSVMLGGLSVGALLDDHPADVAGLEVLVDQVGVAWGLAGGGLCVVLYGMAMPKPGATELISTSSLLTTQDLPSASTPVMNSRMGRLPLVVVSA